MTARLMLVANALGVLLACPICVFVLATEPLGGIDRGALGATLLACGAVLEMARRELWR